MINSIKYCILVMALVGFVTVPALALSLTVTNLKTVTMQEIFKDVKGYEGLYQVSNLGRVKNLERWRDNGNGGYIQKERILKPRKSSNDYLTVSLCNGTQRTRTVHQLVAESFLNHKSNNRCLVVDHVNFNRFDNQLSNLRIITQRENTNQRHLKSSSKYVGVCWHKTAKKWYSSIRINGKAKHIGYFTNELEASKAYQNKLSTLNTKLL